VWPAQTRPDSAGNGSLFGLRFLFRLRRRWTSGRRPSRSPSEGRSPGNAGGPTSPSPIGGVRPNGPCVRLQDDGLGRWPGTPNRGHRPNQGWRPSLGERTSLWDSHPTPRLRNKIGIHCVILTVRRFVRLNEVCLLKRPMGIEVPQWPTAVYGRCPRSGIRPGIYAGLEGHREWFVVD
jgi:hypothetical protein